MRAVILNRTDHRHKGPQPDRNLRNRLAGHLAARLREYQGEGIEDVSQGDGVVSTRISGLSGTDAAQRLAEQGVYCEDQGDCILFAIGAHTCFEELDYVQAVVSELL